MRVSFTFLFVFIATSVFAQPYAPPVGQVGTSAMHKDSSDFVVWGSGCTVVRGWQDISDTALGLATTGVETNGIGAPLTIGIVSLGDGGSATISFNGVLFDGPGPDFAVFENAFDDFFLELGFVEVSSDGINYFRFDAVSLTDTVIQTDGFGNTDATNLYNLAGKYKLEYGTPFDLNELDGIIGLDIDSVRYVKVIDVVGSVNPLYASYDSNGNAINDPWPTDFPQGGFDFDAVGGIHFVELTDINDRRRSEVSIYPNPVRTTLNIQLRDNSGSQVSFDIYNLDGKKVKTFQGRMVGNRSSLNVSDLESGIYFLKVISQAGTFQSTFVRSK
ncbi:MAG: T9SS type A sorting domain-containing protein [Bacteroidetes bacterium]|nr:T9SS type A sorting domain-containing protein [Bacteroidota bacterium]